MYASPYDASKVLQLTLPFRELLYDISYTVCVLLKEDDNRGACTASVFGIFMFVG